MFDGVGSPLTQTFGLGISEPMTAMGLDAIEEFFKTRGSDVFHEVSPLAGVEMFATLAKRGYSPTELSSVLFRTLGPHPKTSGVDPRIRVREVDMADAEMYADTCARGWGESPELRSFVAGMARITVEQSHALLAEIDGAPVATGALFVRDGVALFAGASTVPEGRRQGAQLALLDARLRLAASKGCDLATMCTAPGSASQRNAERHGFRIAYTRTKWRL